MATTFQRALEARRAWSSHRSWARSSRSGLSLVWDTASVFESRTNTSTSGRTPPSLLTE